MTTAAGAVGREQRAWCYMLEASDWGAVGISKLALVEIAVINAQMILGFF